MLQSLLKIFITSLFLIFVSGTGGYAAPSNSSQATISVGDTYRFSKDRNRHDLKLMHPGSLRCRIPQPQKSFCPKVFLKADYTAQEALPLFLSGSTSVFNSADSAYILGIIYPFHFFY